MSDETGQGSEQQPTEMSEEGAAQGSETISTGSQEQAAEGAMSMEGAEGQSSEGGAASNGDQMSEPATVAVVTEEVIEIGEAAPTEMSPEPSTVDDELVSRLEGELAKARDVVVAAERAASAVGLSTATTGGRIECEYDLQTETLVARSVSFELEF